METSQRFVATLLAILMVSAAQLPSASIASADEVKVKEQEVKEQEMGVPAPEQPSAETPQTPEPVIDTGNQVPTGTPSYERDVKSIPPEKRPGGIWGPLAVAADLLVMRPIGFVSLFAGGAAFVAVSPVAAATQTVGSRVDALHDRAKDVFTRPLGAL